ncbi:hypothetical protein JL720_7235 [Aureococcus anophagefferens]|nr:hypothetical protein JL720_7235 [Aureococcus anophagefferens]
MRVLRFKNRFAIRCDPPGGYRDIQLVVKFRGLKHLCELQVHLRDFKDLKDHGGHATYDMTRQMHMFDKEFTSASDRWAPEVPGLRERVDTICRRIEMGALSQLTLDYSTLDEMMAQQLAIALTSDSCQLSVLSLRNCQVSDGVVPSVVGSGGAVLRDVRLGSEDFVNGEFGDDGVHAITSSCAELHKLDLDRCRPNLGLDDGVVDALTACPFLAELDAVATALKNNRTLLDLDLADAGLGDDAIARLSEGLARNKTLGGLGLDGNRFETCASLARSGSLARLSLRRVPRFSAASARALGAALKGNGALRTLRLSAATLHVQDLRGDVGVRAEQRLALCDKQLSSQDYAVVSRLLEANKKLTALDVSGNDTGASWADDVRSLFDDAAVVRTLQTVKVHAHTLDVKKICGGEHVEYARAGLARIDAFAVAALLRHNTHIRVVDLCHNGVQSDAIVDLCDALRGKTSLSSLLVAGNNFAPRRHAPLFARSGDDGAAAPLDASSPLCAVTCLMVVDSWAILKEDTTFAVKSALKGAHTFEDKQMQLLCGVLCTHDRLRSLALKGAELTEAGVRDLVVALGRNRTLETLDLRESLAPPASSEAHAEKSFPDLDDGDRVALKWRSLDRTWYALALDLGAALEGHERMDACHIFPLWTVRKEDLVALDVRGLGPNADVWLDGGGEKRAGANDVLFDVVESHAAKLETFSLVSGEAWRAAKLHTVISAPKLRYLELRHCGLTAQNDLDDSVLASTKPPAIGDIVDVDIVPEELDALRAALKLDVEARVDAKAPPKLAVDVALGESQSAAAFEDAVLDALCGPAAVHGLPPNESRKWQGAALPTTPQPDDRVAPSVCVAGLLLTYDRGDAGDRAVLVAQGPKDEADGFERAKGLGSAKAEAWTVPLRRGLALADPADVLRWASARLRATHFDCRVVERVFGDEDHGFQLVVVATPPHDDPERDGWVRACGTAIDGALSDAPWAGGAAAGGEHVDRRRFSVAFASGEAVGREARWTLDLAPCHLPATELVGFAAHEFSEGHGGEVTSVAVSGDGNWVATGSCDKTARVWDADSGACLATLTGHGSFVRGVAFSPDGTRVATASQDHTAKVWDAATGSLLRTLEGHELSVNAVAFSPDGHRLATASRDKTALVWDLRDDAAPPVVLEGHDSCVNGCAFAPDGSRVATASNDKRCIVWDAATGEELESLEGHENWVEGCAFSPDGARVATASQDHHARVWEGGVCVMTLAGHGKRVNGVAFAGDGATLVTASDDETAKRWDLATGACLETMHHRSEVNACAFGRGGTLVATACNDRTAKLWDAATAARTRTLNGCVRTAVAEDACFCVGDVVDWDEGRLEGRVAGRRSGGAYRVARGDGEVDVAAPLRLAARPSRSASRGASRRSSATLAWRVARVDGDGAAAVAALPVAVALPSRRTAAVPAARVRLEDDAAEGSPRPGPFVAPSAAGKAMAAIGAWLGDCATAPALAGAVADSALAHLRLGARLIDTRSLLRDASIDLTSDATCFAPLERAGARDKGANFPTCAVVAALASRNDALERLTARGLFRDDGDTFAAFLGHLRPARRLRHLDLSGNGLGVAGATLRASGSSRRLLAGSRALESLVLRDDDLVPRAVEQARSARVAQHPAAAARGAWYWREADASKVGDHRARHPTTFREPDLVPYSREDTAALEAASGRGDTFLALKTRRVDLLLMEELDTTLLTKKAVARVAEAAPDAAALPGDVEATGLPRLELDPDEIVEVEEVRGAWMLGRAVNTPAGREAHPGWSKARGWFLTKNAFRVNRGARAPRRSGASATPRRATASSSSPSSRRASTSSPTTRATRGARSRPRLDVSRNGIVQEHKPGASLRRNADLDVKPSGAPGSFAHARASKGARRPCGASTSWTGGATCRGTCSTRLDAAALPDGVLATLFAGAKALGAETGARAILACRDATKQDARVAALSDATARLELAAAPRRDAAGRGERRRRRLRAVGRVRGAGGGPARELLGETWHVRRFGDTVSSSSDAIKVPKRRVKLRGYRERRVLEPGDAVDVRRSDADYGSGEEGLARSASLDSLGDDARAAPARLAQGWVKARLGGDSYAVFMEASDDDVYYGTREDGAKELEGVFDRADIFAAFDEPHVADEAVRDEYAAAWASGLAALAAHDGAAAEACRLGLAADRRVAAVLQRQLLLESQPSLDRGPVLELESVARVDPDPRVARGFARALSRCRNRHRPDAAKTEETRRTPQQDAVLRTLEARKTGLAGASLAEGWDDGVTVFHGGEPSKLRAVMDDGFRDARSRPYEASLPPGRLKLSLRRCAVVGDGAARLEDVAGMGLVPKRPFAKLAATISLPVASGALRVDLTVKPTHCFKAHGSDRLHFKETTITVPVYSCAPDGLQVNPVDGAAILPFCVDVPLELASGEEVDDVDQGEGQGATTPASVSPRDGAGHVAGLRSSFHGLAETKAADLYVRLEGVATMHYDIPPADYEKSARGGRRTWGKHYGRGHYTSTEPAYATLYSAAFGAATRTTSALDLGSPACVLSTNLRPATANTGEATFAETIDADDVCGGVVVYVDGLGRVKAQVAGVVVGGRDADEEVKTTLRVDGDRRTNEDEWWHVAVVFDGDDARCKIYMNGDLDGSNSPHLAVHALGADAGATHRVGHAELRCAIKAADVCVGGWRPDGESRDGAFRGELRRVRLHAGALDAVAVGRCAEFKSSTRLQCDLEGQAAGPRKGYSRHFLVNKPVVATSTTMHTHFEPVTEPDVFHTWVSAHDATRGDLFAAADELVLRDAAAFLPTYILRVRPRNQQDSVDEGRQAAIVDEEHADVVDDGDDAAAPREAGACARVDAFVAAKVGAHGGAADPRAWRPFPLRRRLAREADGLFADAYALHRDVSDLRRRVDAAASKTEERSGSAEYGWWSVGAAAQQPDEADELFVWHRRSTCASTTARVGAVDAFLARSAGDVVPAGALAAVDLLCLGHGGGDKTKFTVALARVAPGHGDHPALGAVRELTVAQSSAENVLRRLASRPQAAWTEPQQAWLGLVRSLVDRRHDNHADAAHRLAAFLEAGAADVDAATRDFAARAAAVAGAAAALRARAAPPTCSRPAAPRTGRASATAAATRSSTSSRAPAARYDTVGLVARRLGLAPSDVTPALKRLHAALKAVGASLDGAVGAWERSAADAEAAVVARRSGSATPFAAGAAVARGDFGHLVNEHDETAAEAIEQSGLLELAGHDEGHEAHRGSMAAVDCLAAATNARAAKRAPLKERLSCVEKMTRQAKTLGDPRRILARTHESSVKHLTDVLRATLAYDTVGACADALEAILDPEAWRSPADWPGAAPSPLGDRVKVVAAKHGFLESSGGYRHATVILRLGGDRRLKEFGEANVKDFARYHAEYAAHRGDTRRFRAATPLRCALGELAPGALLDELCAGSRAAPKVGASVAGGADADRRGVGGPGVLADDTGDEFEAGAVVAVDGAPVGECFAADLTREPRGALGR